MKNNLEISYALILNLVFHGTPNNQGFEKERSVLRKEENKCFFIHNDKIKLNLNLNYLL